MTSTNKLIGKAANTMQAMAMKKQGLKLGIVEAWEDGYRTAGEKNAFEWWYFDCQLDDGSSCVIVFFTKPNLKPKLPLKPSVLSMYRSSDGEKRHDWSSCAVNEFSSSTEGCDVKMGPNWVKGDLNHYQLHADVAGITYDLTIANKVSPLRVGAGIGFIDPLQKKYFGWVAPVPYGIAEGKLTVDGKTRNVKGTAYHDHNWGSMLIAEYFDHWYWGRGHVGDYRFAFVQMTTNSLFGLGAIKVPIFFLAKGDETLIGGVENGLPLRLEPSEFVDGPAGRKYPAKLDLSWKTENGKVSITVRNPEVIGELDLRGRDDDEPRFRKLLMHLIADSYHIDFDADFELEINMNGINDTVNGSMVFEQMLLHKKRRG
ncbi:MAG: hypothetical protein JW738_03575 [Actinobacteria bacterium]|nr:hypothetical protein [Actinomycetota bacterium]